MLSAQRSSYMHVTFRIQKALSSAAYYSRLDDTSAEKFTPELPLNMGLVNSYPPSPRFGRFSFFALSGSGMPCSNYRQQIYCRRRVELTRGYLR